MKNIITIIGAGLAGCEAAYQLSKRGVRVRLYEMKPKRRSPAHAEDYFAELVCSNSLRSDDPKNAAGLLKEEMRALGSLILACAEKAKVPAGGALSVDRDKFGALVTEMIKSEKNIEIISEEAVEIKRGAPCIIASGPLTSDALIADIKKLVDGRYLYFFDAAAPIVSRDGIDMSKAFYMSRYDKGAADYLNCPLSTEEYQIFYRELIAAETVKLKDFENDKVFEGCLPIEVMAARGADTMRFGPLKPVGLFDKKNNIKPYAVVQLRKENLEGTMYNLVGFQTHLTFGEQRRVFSLIPALKDAEFLRYGVMHKNTFINSPVLLDKFFCLKSLPSVYFAGQISGVEGYTESASSGLLAALNLYSRLTVKPIDYDNTTAITSLACYVAAPNARFQPMNVNFGIFKPLESEIKDKSKRKDALLERAHNNFRKFFNAFL
jgi:methylenetetrahydrofolate--tRNA-(uracil-5-)-methyltransferase